MNFKCPNTKNLMSKDFNVANKECKRILDECDIETFSDLCENSEFIFDFIKAKINKNFLSNLNKDNYLNLLKFTKIYCGDFEDFIVMGLVKFANEDLTDKILELFEEGNDEEKTYCARYFYYIQDPLALDCLRKCALSNFAPLSFNSSQTLSAFNDRVLYDEEIKILKNGNDDYEKIKAVCFLAFYGDKSAFDVIYDYMKITPFLAEVVESLMELKSIFEVEFEKALYLYNNLLDLYPEFISLDTLIPYEIKEFIKSLLEKGKEPFVSYVLYKTKMKFDILQEGDVYTYDLSKETKEEINEIIKITNNIDENLKNNFGELLKEDDNRLKENVLDTIIENKIDYYEEGVRALLNSSDNDVIIYKSLSALKSFGENLPKDVISKIKNENIKAMAESLY